MPDPFSQSRLRGTIRGAALVATLAFLAVAWPARLGGRALFVVVAGTSMEPGYHNGDLLYAHTSDAFHVGDVAVFRIPPDQPGNERLVVHRIRSETTTGHFITQGDNRSQSDGIMPSPTDMVARPVVNLGPIPRYALQLLPWACLMTAAAATGWYLWPKTIPPAGLSGVGSLAPPGVDLRGTWATIRDATIAHAPLLPVVASDPFAAPSPMTLRDLLRFIGAADQERTAGCR